MSILKYVQNALPATVSLAQQGNSADQERENKITINQQIRRERTKLQSIHTTTTNKNNKTGDIFLVITYYLCL